MTTTSIPPQLPDPLHLADGSPIVHAAQWPQRRAELRELFQHWLFGSLPPAPDQVRLLLLYDYYVKQCKEVFCSFYRLTIEPGDLSLVFQIFMPAGDGPFPVIINGDGCWRYLDNELISTVVGRGYALAVFNRLELAPDILQQTPQGGLYDLYPAGEFGALAAWAWGYMRLVDACLQLPFLDNAHIAVSGHSRGGKSALLAGAFDERIALTVPNGSGCAGAGCLRFPDEGGEPLATIYKNFPYWFTTHIRQYIGREAELPFDLHELKALVAPRLLLSTESRDDIWASPHGTRLTHEAARRVFHFLSAEENIGLYYRNGDHAHTLEDWLALLDFADLHWYGKASQREFDMHP